MRGKITLSLIALLSVGAIAAKLPVQRGGRIVTATFTDVKTLNPFLSTDSETSSYSRLINAGLTRLNPQTQQIEAALAESWESSADQLEWVFRLRRGLRWSDGQPFSASDVLFTMQIVNDKSITSLAHDALKVLGKPIQWAPLDSYSIQATLPSKHVTFLRHLDAGVCPILAKHRWQTLYESGKFSEVMQPGGERLPGMGPFQVKSFVPGQTLALARNPHYWKKDSEGVSLPYLEEIVFLILANQDQVELKIENGEIDTYQSVRASDVDRLRQRKDKLQLSVINIGPTLEMEGFFFNQNRGINPADQKHYVDPVKLSWFTDLNFRQAISHSIDREGMVRNALFGHGLPAFSPESPGNKFWYNNKVSRYPYDLKRAKDLLKKSGFQEKRNQNGQFELFDRNGNRVKFSLFTNANNTIRQAECILIVSDLAKLGMEVTYNAMDFATLVNLVNKTFQYDAVLLGLNRDDPDPGDRRNMLLSSGSLHFWWPRQQKPFTPWEERIDALIALTMSDSEANKRKQYYDEVQKIFVEQQPMIFTFHPFGFVCARKKIANLKPVVSRHRTLWNAEELYWEK